MLEAGLRADAAQVIHLEYLWEIGNLHIVGRAVSLILEQRFHELRDDFHAPLARC